MDCKISTLSLLLLVACVAAQYEDFGGYEGYHHKAQVHLQQQQNLDDSQEGHGEDFDLDYHAHPKYSFDYSVKDPHTGDQKEHWETRDGDKVKGSYTLIETDGTKRVVEYEADDKNGFNAVVHKIGTPKQEEYEPKYEKYEKYEAKPAHEPVHYQHDFGDFDEGFVPVSGGFEH